MTPPAIIAFKVPAVLLVVNVVLAVMVLKVAGGQGAGSLVAIFQDYGRAMLPSGDLLFQSNLQSVVLTLSVTLSAILIGKLFMRALIQMLQR
jgi:hypothetical protein